MVDRARELWNLDPSLPEAQCSAIAATLSREFGGEISSGDVSSLSRRYCGFTPRQHGGHRQSAELPPKVPVPRITAEAIGYSMESARATLRREIALARAEAPTAPLYRSGPLE